MIEAVHARCLVFMLTFAPAVRAQFVDLARAAAARDGNVSQAGVSGDRFREELAEAGR